MDRSLRPGFDRNTVSGMVSRWHRVLCALGYPELDVREFYDGEIMLIQYLNTPVVPSLTRWQPVLQGVRNVEISVPWLKHWAERLDLNKRAVWDKLDAEDKENWRLIKEKDRRAEDFANRMTDGIMRNPDLVERIAKNGLKEATMGRLRNHLSRGKMGHYAKDWREN